MITTAAQVDRRGYVWVATPDGETTGPHDAMYVVDPHAAVVHRVIELPDTLRAVADLSIYDDGVYVRAWRNGFSGGIGRIAPDCVVDEARCAASLFVDLGNVGGSYGRSILRIGDVLFSASVNNSRDRRHSTDRISVASGTILASAPFVGGTVTEGSSLFVTTRVRTGEPELVRLHPETLDVTAATAVPNSPQIAYEEGIVYLSASRGATVTAYDAETLEPTRTYAIPEGASAHDTFAFAAPGVLMLNGTASLAVESGDILIDPARGTAEMGRFQRELRLPQGR